MSERCCFEQIDADSAFTKKTGIKVFEVCHADGSEIQNDEDIQEIINEQPVNSIIVIARSNIQAAFMEHVQQTGETNKGKTDSDDWRHTSPASLQNGSPHRHQKITVSGAPEQSECCTAVYETNAVYSALITVLKEYVDSPLFEFENVNVQHLDPEEVSEELKAHIYNSVIEQLDKENSQHVSFVQRWQECIRNMDGMYEVSMQKYGMAILHHLDYMHSRSMLSTDSGLRTDGSTYHKHFTRQAKNSVKEVGVKQSA